MIEGFVVGFTTTGGVITTIPSLAFFNFCQLLDSILNNAVISGQSENDQPLVCDVLLYHLHLDCNAVPKPLKAPMAKELMTLLSFSKPEAQKLLANFYKKSRSRRLALWLDQNQKEKTIQITYSWQRDRWLK